MSSQSEVCPDITAHVKTYEEGFQAQLKGKLGNPYNYDDDAQKFHAWGLGWADSAAQ